MPLTGDVKPGKPNSHKGMIYCSNLCTEIARILSPMETVSQTVETEDGDPVVVTRVRPGGFVWCVIWQALWEIFLWRRIVLKNIISATIRALDNVIGLTTFILFPMQSLQPSFRSIGLRSLAITICWQSGGLNGKSGEPSVCGQAF